MELGGDYRSGNPHLTCQLCSNTQHIQITISTPAIPAHHTLVFTTAGTDYVAPIQGVSQQ